MATPLPVHASTSSAPASTEESTGTAIPARLAGYFAGYPIRVATHPAKGRYVVATESLPAGRLVFHSLAYSAGVHDSYRKRVCDVCLRYNHAGRFERACAKCHAVWWCSDACRERAQGRSAAAETSGSTEAASSSTAVAAASPSGASCSPPPPASTAALPASELHALDCALLRKLSSCKLDKARIGVIRLLIRTYRKVEAEKRLEQEAAEVVAAAASSPSVLPPLAVKLDGAPPVYRPSYHDLASLIGHPPPPLVPGQAATSHQLDWADLRKYLGKISSRDANDPDHLDLDRVMRIMAQVESNGFGLYAEKRAKSAAAGEDVAVEEVKEDGANEAPASNESPTPSPAACPTVALDSVSSSKWVGVLLYPTASYFNHSCAPNVRVVQVGHELVMSAARDIAEGEELCIHAELFDLYKFHCDCARCASELAAKEGAPMGVADPAAAVAAASSTPAGKRAKVSYATDAQRARSGQKKGLPPKRKKIEPKYHREEEAQQDEA